jgi:hypothetical protein
VVEWLGSESVHQFAEEQYDRGGHRSRKQPRRVKLVGDRVGRRIVLVDLKETNGHTHDERREAAV